MVIFFLAKERFLMTQNNFAKIQLHNNYLARSISYLNTILEELGENAKETQQLQVAQMFYTAVITNWRSFFVQLQLLIYQLRQPELVNLFFKLIANPSHCEDTTCYRNTHFQITAQEIILHTKQQTITMQPLILTSCSIIQNTKTSIFHS